MKTTVLASASIAALLLAGAAAAQTAPTSPNVTTQTMSSHSALIDQIGDSNDKATIHQDDASVTDTSAGADAAVVIQGGAGFSSAAKNNTANVTQSGAGQRGLIMQSTNGGSAGNTATLTQTGDHNNAFGYQFGTGNKATLTQSMTAGAATSGTNLQNVQSSSDNQTGINAAVALRQMTVQGARNAAEAGMLGGSNSYNKNLGYVTQDWAQNDTATLNQSGKNNQAVSVQGYENGSTANMTQSGQYNQGVVQQQGSASTGSGNAADLNQSGYNSWATIAQIDSTGSVATTTQDASSSGSHSYTYQTGIKNYASVYQNGAAQSSEVNQAGNMDSALVSQTGSYNTSSVQQNLANSWASVTQTGSSSTASISQGAVTSFRNGR